jgi:acetyltransferase-like isoleucine patch superfamily enzyme
MNLRQILARIRYPNTYSSEAYVKYLRGKGCCIGEHTIFFSPSKTLVDVTRPHLINIGDYCKITSGVIILSHDYSRSVIRLKYKEIIAEAGPTYIGNNVFIGMNAIILRNVNIGNNVVIGAGSVVTDDIKDDVVVVGNPAKILMSLDEYYKKRKEIYISEAKEYAQLLYNKCGSKPTIRQMNNFYPLYLKRDLAEIKKHDLQINYSGDDYEDIVKYFLESKPIYKDFDDFLRDAGIK